MKQTRYTPNPNQPFGFHDCHINGIDVVGGNLKLSFKDFFYTIGGPDVCGDVVIEAIEPECCEIIIQGRGGKKGGFRGEKLTIQEFVEKYKGFSFEVIDEYYGWHRLQLVGWLWMTDTYPKDMTLSLGYFKGDVIYNTEEIPEER